MGWLLAIVAGGLLTFNAVVTPDKAADAATKALKQKFPGATVNVKIEGKRGKDVLNGRFKRIDIELADLTLSELPISASAPGNVSAPVSPDAPVEVTPVKSDEKPRRVVTKAPKLGRAGEINIAVSRFKWNKLAVERADFHFENVEYDFGALKNRSEFQLIRTEGATMHLELAPDALTPFVAERVANVSNPRVQIADGALMVSGERVFYGITAPFEVKGAPGFSGTQVILNAPALHVSGITVPPLVAAPLLKSVNPLYSFSDLKALPFDVKLTRVFARDGKLQIDADLTLKR